MNGIGRDTRNILVTVKTYPSPSMQYEEIVCVAGVDTKTKEWMRLYPVPFRDLPSYQQFRKYSVISVEVEKHRSDPRPESYRPDVNSLRVLEPLPTDDGWERRRQVVMPTVSASMCAIQRERRETGKRSAASDPSPWMTS